MKTPEILAEAVKSYKEGKKESFDQVYELSYRYLHTCIFHVLKEEDAAMDMLQETYLEISKSIEQLKNCEDFLSWAATIANRKCFQYIKKKHDILLGENEKENFFETIPDDDKFIPESVLQDREKQKLIKEIIDGLSDIQRLCVIGYYYNEERQEQIAEELQVPVNTVKSHLNRAKAKIKEALVDLDEKQGIRLYSIAPFLLLFFAKEAEDCELIPMSQTLKAEIYGNEAVKAGSAADHAAKVGKAVGSGMKIKLGIGIAVIAVAALIGGVLLNQSQDETVELVEDEAAEALDQTQVEESNSEDADTLDETAAEEEANHTEEVSLEESFNQLAISGEYDQIGTARNGRAIVCKDEKWGLVTYDNQILVPLEYDYAQLCINDDGQVLLANDGAYRVFDENGNLLFQSEKSIKSVSDGIVLIVERDQESLSFNYQYLYLDGSVCYEPEMPGFIGQMGAVGFNEGCAVAATVNEEICLAEDGSYTSIDAKRVAYRKATEPPEEDVVVNIGGVQIEGNGGSGGGYLMGYPIGIYHNGYYVSAGMNFEDTHGNYHVLNPEGTEQYNFRMRDLYEYAGYDFSDPNVSWTVYGYAVNGSYCYSYGTILNVALRNGEDVAYYLFDLSRLDWGIDAMYQDKMIITEDALLAVGDHISISDNKYWLYCKDGKWGYIDHDGNVMEMFDDASEFVNGKAMVIEGGKAYFIDEDFNRTETEILADSVKACGEIFEIVSGESHICLENQ